MKALSTHISVSALAVAVMTSTAVAVVPVVTNTVPADNATGWSVTGDLVVQFDVAVDTIANWRSGTVKNYDDDTTYFEFGESAANGWNDTAVQGRHTTQITIPLPWAFEPNTHYYVSWNGTFLENDSDGDDVGALVKDDWDFTTGADATPPTASLYPNDINDTEGPNVRIDSVLLLIFDERVTNRTGSVEIRKGTDDSLVESFDVETTTRFTFSGANGEEVTINPISDFAYNTDYYVLIGTNAFSDMNTNYYDGVTNKLTWEFTTQEEPVLLAHLPLDGNAHDISTAGANHDGDVQGGASYIADRFSYRQALSLDGIDDYVTLTNSAIDLNREHFSTPPYSFNIWFKTPAGTTNGAIVGRAVANYHNGVHYLLQVSPESKLRGTCQARVVDSALTVDDDVWHMGTWVSYYDNEQRAQRWEIYLDGVYAGRTGDVSSPQTVDTLLGARRAGDNNSTADFLAGAIDDFRFYDNSLTSDQVMELYLWVPPPQGSIVLVK